MEQRTFEGTWEEIILNASEFAGRRVKLTVLTDENPKPPDYKYSRQAVSRKGRGSQFRAIRPF